MRVSATLFLSFGLTTACESDPSSSCGEHGEPHGDHCHCDTGYTEVDGICVARQPNDTVNDTSSTDTAADSSPTDTVEDTSPTDTVADSSPTDTVADSIPTDTTADSGPTDTDAPALDLSEGTQKARALTASNGDRFRVFEAQDLPLVLTLELYPAFGGPSAPDSIALTQSETDYGTCGTCLVLQSGCYAHDDHFHCDKTFMPEVGGEVVLTEIGTRQGAAFAGHLHDIVFREVTIAQDYTTTPVPNGERFSLEHWPIETTITP